MIRPAADKENHVNAYPACVSGVTLNSTAAEYVGLAGKEKDELNVFCCTISLNIFVGTLGFDWTFDIETTASSWIQSSVEGEGDVFVTATGGGEKIPPDSNLLDTASRETCSVGRDQDAMDFGTQPRFTNTSSEEEVTKGVTT